MRLIKKKSSILLFNESTMIKTGLEREGGVVNIFLSSIKQMRNNKTLRDK
jgi:hypothetical protein